MNKENKSNESFGEWLEANQSNPSASVEANPTESVEANSVKKKMPFDCDKCDGTGEWSKSYFYHDRGHVTYKNKCHACNGVGGFKSSSETRQKAKVARVQKAKADRAQNIADFKKEYGEDVAVFLVTEAWSGDNDFMKSLYEQVGKGRDLSEKQMQAIYNGMARQSDYEARKEDNKKPKTSVDMNNILNSLNTAKGNKLKKPILRTADEQSEKSFTFSMAPEHGNNAGFVYVKEDNLYLGKINAKGEFFGWETAKDTLEALERVSANLKEASVKYGRITGKCGMCNRSLTNHGSIEKGIGPICEEKYGL